MDTRAKECLSEFLRICSQEMDAGNCNLTEAEASAVIDTFIKARRRELDPQSEAAMLRRIAESYVNLADKVDCLYDDMDKMKKGGKIIKMSPRV